MPPFSVSPTALTHTPDFHPEDHSPNPLAPMPVQNGRLVVPLHWCKLWGLDFGIGHPFGAVLTAWDRDSDVFYVLKEIKISDSIPDVHAAAIRRIDTNAPLAWPHDGHDRDKGSGEPLKDIYRKLDLKMLPEHATFPEGGYSTEAAVFEIDQRMRTGRFRVCEDCNDWFGEYRLYHRKKGLIVKEDDDLLSATMKALMMRRFAKPGPIGYTPARRRVTGARPSTAFDIFTGRPWE